MKISRSTNPNIVTYSWWLTAWTQWEFWDVTFNNVEKLDKIPTDPITDKKYTYSTTATRQEYEIAWIMEGDEVSFLWNQTNAATKTARAKVMWNYNWKMLKVVDGTTIYVLAVPSIITASWLTVETIAQNNNFVYNGYKNLPVSYLWSSYEILWDDTVTFMNNSDLVLFSWEVLDLSNTNQVWVNARKALIEKIQSAYTWTVLSSVWEIAEILSVEESKIESLASVIVSNDLWGSIIAISNWST